MVTGIVIIAMGLASLYIAPITTKLIVSKTFLMLDIFILVVGSLVDQLITNPLEGYTLPVPAGVSNTKIKKVSVKYYPWKEMIKTMMIVFIIQGTNMLVFASYSTPLAISIGTSIAGVLAVALVLAFITKPLSTSTKTDKVSGEQVA